MKRLLVSGIGRRAYSSSKVPLTSTRKPELSRGEYAVLGDADLTVFERIVGKSRVLTADLDGFNTDWLNTCRGESKCVLKPGSVDEVSAIVAHCVQRRLALCPQGGNTGLVGGSVPVFDEVVLSLTNINTVHDFDPVSGILVCDAGCVLETLDAHVAEQGYMMPLDLGAKGSCHIGGNVATGAGGVRLLRYGSLHAHLLGVEAGTLIDSMKPLRKDNTGLHIPQLFIGSEGQLGILTKVAMTVVPRPTSVQVAFLAVENFQQCTKLLSLAKFRLGEVLSSYEFLDEESMRCAKQNLKMTNPLEGAEEKAKFYILVETGGSNEGHDQEKLSAFLEEVKRPQTRNFLGPNQPLPSVTTQS